MQIAVMFALAILVVINAHASVRVVAHDGLSPSQKVFQVAVIWVLPIVGAWLVYLIVFARPSRPRDPGFDAADQDSTPIGS